MQVKVITDLSNEPITGAEIINYLKVDESIVAENALIDLMIKTARGLCEKKTNLSFGEKTLEATFDKDEIAFNSLRLPYGPHAQIISVYGLDIEGNETLIESTDYWSVGNDIWEVRFKAGGYLYESYRVTYIAGYGISEATPKKATSEIPSEAVLAIYKQVASWYDNRDDYIPTLNSEVRKILDRITKSTWF